MENELLPEKNEENVPYSPGKYDLSDYVGYGNLMNGDGRLEKPIVPEHKMHPRYFVKTPV